MRMNVYQMYQKQLYTLIEIGWVSIGPLLQLR